MAKYIINGGRPLSGEVTISGAKNAAVAIIPAALLVDGVCRIENVPAISDVNLYLKIFEQMGAQIRRIDRSTIEMDCRGVRSHRPPFDIVSRFRASSYLIGAMLGRFGEAEVALPGGCDFGQRPIDQHIKGFTAMGAKVEFSGAAVHARADGKLKGNYCRLDLVSVGATMNLMIAAVLAEGTTIIEPAAKEPHIVDLANFLNAMGADVWGAGTDTIKVRGVERLHGGTYSIIPDQIEAGTYLTAVTAAGGEALIKNVIPKHLECITGKLIEMGAEITEYDDSVHIRRTGTLHKANIKTMPYPGYPTDMQPQAGVCLALAEGTSIITEGVFDNRYKYVNELIKMGAQIQVDGKVAIFEGVPSLKGCPIKACDLRAGAAMVIAALAAEGQSVVDDVFHIERGYETFVEKLRDLGADIRRVEDMPPVRAKIG